MKFRLEVKEEALQDIAEAMQWYKPKAVNLDTKFLAAVEEGFNRILLNPFAFKKIYKSFRQTGVRTFPYVIVYTQEKDTVIIISVFNTWQHPRKKLGRLKK
ncbi:MAG: type II toxin-antitoxin system RelE/ParE family toxin [Chitinophagaceae bacterium]